MEYTKNSFIANPMNTPINLNISDIETKFKEIYKDPQEYYLWPTYLLGYTAGLLPKIPDVAIPGQDAHMVVAAYLGRVNSEIEKENKRFMERCATDDGFVSFTEPQSKIKNTSITW